MRYKIIGLILLIIVVAGGSLSLWYQNGTHQTYQKSSTSQFVIATGESTPAIINRLVGNGLVSNYWTTLIYVKMHHIILIPGTFTVPISYTTPQLIALFSAEPKKDTKLVIPEGWNKEQIADSLAAHNLSGPKFLELAKSAEGTLFPDTYNIDDKTTETDLFTRMTNQYAKVTADLQIDRNSLILASIVEREAKNDTDRPIIAAIYKNRLRLGMKLEADPTVQYAKYVVLGQAVLKDGKVNYWAPITVADYTGVQSSYNTYLNSGLPPGPICNPGLKSLDAVVNSSGTSALYFFHTASGQLITSSTLAEHNANKAKYLK